MNFPQAAVADILRGNQRDQAFVNDLETQLHSFLKHINVRAYHKIRTFVPSVANIWYYYMTSLGNLQTLGEEYSGTIRLTRSNRIPTGLQQLIWMILYIGGEPLIDKVLTYTETSVKKSPSLTQRAKDELVKFIQIFMEHKFTIKRIHHSLFYIGGKYYNIANRITGIKYVLLRDWMHDDSFSGSFKILGQLSLFYILFTLIYQIISIDSQFNSKDIQNISENISQSAKTCVLCVDNIKSPTATPCGHVFCWNCLCDYLNYQKACPICRDEILPSRIMFLQNYI
ncbi:unnamed protein product [Ceutorhynchus assimilis]|uniref:RING-type E3 ubiquitin transferase n=1 Tax=Ceutorhynchus assimilis TaxID=467358 RepID=A0A9N9MK53_9CUCU|nr:unnamed protein product [Ceutorhynchus assimilis]